MRTALIAIIAVGLLAACSRVEVPNNANTRDTASAPVTSRTEDPPAPALPSPAKSPADEAASKAAEFQGTAGVTDKKNPSIKGVAVLNEVRSATHDGYDRVVFEFTGSELPGYHVEYIDKPVRSCGSGDTVPFAGDGWLEIRFSDAQAHTSEGQPSIKDRNRSPNLPIVKDLKITCDFEAEVTWVVGAASPNLYRLTELKNPTRLVVDIKHK